MENDIPGAIAGSQLQSSCTKVVRVGSSLYALGWPRRVMERKGINQWHLMDQGMTLPKKVTSSVSDDIVDAITNYTFHDLAGFSESQIYMVGDGGEIWNWDGSHWSHCAFPTNESLRSVACGNDQVYVTTLHGHVWHRRESEWELICCEDRSIPFRDTFWFANQLWLGCDYGVWTLESGTLSRETLPAEVFLVSGRLDVSSDGKFLLTAGQLRAAMFDGSTWVVLWNCDEVKK